MVEAPVLPDPLPLYDLIILPEGAEKLIPIPAAPEKHLVGLSELFRVVHRLQMRVFVGEDIPEKAGEQADIREQLRMGHGRHRGVGCR